MRKRAKKPAGWLFRRAAGEQRLVTTKPRTGMLEIPADYYRLCYREIASSTNERTLMAVIVPPGTALISKLHFFYRSAFDEAADGYRTVLPAPAMAYVAGLLNSFVLDFVVRRKVSSTVSKAVMSTVPVADVPLRVGIYGNGLAELTDVVLRAYRERYPDVRLQVLDADFNRGIGSLFSGEHQVGLLRTPYNLPELCTTPVFREPMAVYVSRSHRLAKAESIDVVDLFSDPWVHLSPGDTDSLGTVLARA